MVGYGEALMLGFFSLQNDVAALLIDYAVSPITAQSQNNLFPAQIPRQLHALAKISSRTKWSRIEEGSCLGWSK